MNKVKVVILRTAGTNCDGETACAFKLAGAETIELLHINQFIRQERKLAEFDILAIPGGFSYGDDVSAGKILANELKYKIYTPIQKFARAGKPIIGICNGFQVLVKAGLLPGNLCPSLSLNPRPLEPLSPGSQSVTLTFNDSGKFECRWAYLKTVSRLPSPVSRLDNAVNCLWTKNLPEIIYLPVAHGEGKFAAGEESLLDELEHNGQVVLRYVDEKGQSAGYPANPNASQRDIAGICNRQGNILGLMPHPERHILPYQHPHWTRLVRIKKEGDGLAIFRNAVNFVKKG